jgi:hypothetical protein
MSQLAGQHQHAAVRVEDLGPPVGLLDRFAVADRAVIGQDHHVRLVHERDDRVGERLAAGRFVLGDRHVAEKHLDLRQDALRDRLAGDCERGGVRRVAVDHAADVIPLAIDLQVQQRLAGPLLAPGELLAGHVDQRDVVGFEKTFAVQRRGAQHLVLADPDGDVAIVGRGELTVVDPPPDVTHVLFDLFHEKCSGCRAPGFQGVQSDSQP